MTSRASARFELYEAQAWANDSGWVGGGVQLQRPDIRALSCLRGWTGGCEVLVKETDLIKHVENQTKKCPINRREESKALIFHC